MIDINFRDKRNKLLSYRRQFLLYPPDWDDPLHKLPVGLKWSVVKFDSSNLKAVPDHSGLYSSVVKPEHPDFFELAYLMYIGKTTRPLRDRYSEYLRDQSGKGKPRVKIFDMLDLYRDALFFYFAELPSADVHVCEERLINAFVPPVNSDIPKATIKKEFSNIYE